jgi:PKD repeat protein
MFHVAGDVHLNPAYDRLIDTNGFQQPAGEHGYTALVHEIGHALGLKHPHSGTPVMPAELDTSTNTMMSYNFQGESPATPMGFDLLALQYVYGARATRTGDDTYVFRRSDADQFAVASAVFFNPSSGAKLALWDGGGYNTLDFSSVTSDSGYRIDTAPLGWVTTNGNYRTTYYVAGVTLGPGVRIHEIVNSAGDDTIIANSDANTFSGYSPSRATGNDVIVGASANDVIDLIAYSQDEVAQTPSGSDLIIGLDGNGTITVRNYYAGSRPSIAIGTTPAPTPPVEVSVVDAQVTEGSGGAAWLWFAIRLSSAAAETVSVAYATADGTAVAGSDYVASSGTLAFAPGELVKYVVVTVYGDTEVEADEQFRLRLSAPGPNAKIGDGEGEGTIVNDDAAPAKQLMASASATPVTGTAPLVVAFSSAGSVIPDGTAITFAWAFGDGGSSSEANPSYTYTKPGSFTATLTLTEAGGAVATSAVQITVTDPPNLAPIATVSAAPLAGTAPLPVTFSSAGSTDADGTIATYVWSFGDGATAATANPSHTYEAAGTYVVTLTVTDDKGASASASLTVVVSAPKVNTPPVAVLTVSATGGVAPVTIAFSSLGSRDADGTIVEFAWQFGDSGTSTDAHPSHTFANPGTYLVTLTVTDDQGAVHIKSITILVSAPPLTSAVMSVSSIAMDVVPFQTTHVARAFVMVVDENGLPVPNASVSGRWYGLLVTSAVYAFTDANGVATFTSKYLFQEGAIGFAIVGMTKNGLTYDPARNVESKESTIFTKP